MTYRKTTEPMQIRDMLDGLCDPSGTGSRYWELAGLDVSGLVGLKPRRRPRPEVSVTSDDERSVTQNPVIRVTPSPETRDEKEYSHHDLTVLLDCLDQYGPGFGYFQIALGIGNDPEIANLFG